MVSSPLKHIVFVPAPAWSHLRPCLKTALRMVEKFPELFISLFVYHSEMPKANKYLSTQPSMYSRRIRITTASSKEVAPTLANSNPIEMLSYLELSFKRWIGDELQQENTLQVDGRLVDVPSAIMEDVFNGGMSLACKDVHNLPVVGWWLATSSSLMTQEKQNWFSKAAEIYLQINKITFVSRFLDWALNNGAMLLQNASGRLVNIPGLPVHHEWELNPQYFPFMPLFMAYLVPRVTNIINNVDTLVCCTTFEMEPISAVSLSTAFEHVITPLFIGPAVDLASPNYEDPDSPVTQFLDRAHNEKGAHSVIYVAFGTVFFPSQSSMSHLMAALDEIPKAGLRFIFSLSSADAKLERSWMDAHINAGNAIFPEWTNQTAVLEHPATHYFLTHGGWSSCTEALVRGVPMIFWPFTGDQPTNSMQIADIHDCGFELLQIRTGPAKSSAYRKGAEIKIVGTDEAVREEMKHILELSKGSKGELQRTNTQILGQVISDSLGPGGSGDAALTKFGTDVLGLVQ
ncbi:unnamed protein product [Rhizoctonia solani]|uniref:UDP-glycosyltransferase 74C1 n=1 Tax=Rhizoctonia solani TaxID=456999 RepID=A0A8H3ATH4_9AGAM|nr:unnamed protein product [Rhizoctonia solani]